MTDTARPSLLSRVVSSLILALYRARGWRFDVGGGIPPKCVVIGAPHTTNWDFIFFLGGATALGAKPSFIGKASLFRWPMARFMRDMGGIPVDRSRTSRFVDQVAAAFAARERLALVMAPEGTRGDVTQWRSGFYHIAQAAGVPIMPAWVDHSRMCGGVGPAVQPTGDFAADLLTIARFYHSVLPHHPKLAALYAQAGLSSAPIPTAPIPTASI